MTERRTLIRLASDSLVVLAPNRARVAPLDLDQMPQVLEALNKGEARHTLAAKLGSTIASP